jgi:predicted unusual protein kinase regulating ubiquinone biosynthesis (AarF/ABC1/UbiB family)
MATRTNSRAATAAREAVIAMLVDDHKRARKAFRAFEKLDPENDPEECEALVQHTCAELQMHTTLEEEIFYPAVREAIKEQDLLDEAEVEHMTAKQLIERLEGMGPEDDKYAAYFTVLGEYVQHHVKEEEKEMFPKLERAKIDWPALQQEMEARREELMAELMPEAAEEEEEEEEEVEEAPKPRAPGKSTSARKPAGSRAKK